MRTLKWTRLGTAVSMAAGVLAFSASGAPGTTDSVAEAAPNDIVSIVIDGTGFGHGRGMSQWGAYGYAVDHGSDWNQILAHYYGGTDAGTVPAGQRIRVRLTDLDAQSTVGVVSYASPVTWNGFSMASMYAAETSQPGVFQVYGSSGRNCPGASTLSVPSGNPEIAQGSPSSTEVRQIQAFLQAYQSPSIAVDGSFGPLTRQTLVAWQQAQGLAQDGIWNPEDAARANTVIAADSGGGFTLLGTETTSVGDPVSFTIANGDDSTIAPEAAIGLCAPNRTITHYRGSIDVLSTPAGNRVVNDVKVEDYLRGVLPKEISADWAKAGELNVAGERPGVNAVRAQAVAARSYGLQQQRNYFYDGSSTRYATTCDTTACQVYGGASRRSSATGSATSVEHPLTDAAALATANVVRRWPAGHPDPGKAGQLVSTEFSASNGPRTAGGEFPAVDDIGDDTTKNPNHRWTRTLGAADLASKYGLGQITSASMVDAADSRYQVYDGIWFNDLVLTGTNGTKRIQAWDFRNAFNLPSPGFTVRVIRENGGGSSHQLVPPKKIRIPIVGQTLKTPAGDNIVVPSSATAVAINVTGTRSSGSGHVTIWPCATDRRQTSNLNLRSGADIANNVIASIDAAGEICLWSIVGTDVIVDVSGWFDASGSTTPPESVSPERIVNSRFGIGSPQQKLGPDKPLVIDVVGLTATRPDGTTATVPTGVTSVLLNITAVDATEIGYFTVWPCARPRKKTSSLNYAANDAVANGIISAVDENGQVCVYSRRDSHVIVDLQGWFGPTNPAFAATDPHRIVDTRVGRGAPQQIVRENTPLRVPIHGITVPVRGDDVIVPANAVAAVVNVVSTQAEGGGYVTVWSCDGVRPRASNLNFIPGIDVANGVIAPIGSDGSICIYSRTPSHIVVDITGWLVEGFVGATPNRLVDTRYGIGPAPA